MPFYAYAGLQNSVNIEHTHDSFIFVFIGVLSIRLAKAVLSI